MPISNYHDVNIALQDSLDTLNSNTGITQTTPGGKARAILEIMATEHGRLAESFDIEIAEAFVRTASGDSLDLIGELVGVTRKEAQKASVDASHGNVRFYVISGTFGDITGGVPVTITKGTQITAETTIAGTTRAVTYITSEDVELGTSATEVYASAISRDSGSRASTGAGTINNHNFTGYAEYQSDALKVTNTSGIVGGTDRESDINYRYRISNVVVASEAGNLTAITLAALGVAGVADVSIVPYDRGSGSFSVYIKSIYPTVSDALLDKVRESVERVKSFGNSAVILSPKSVGLEATVTLRYRSAITADQKDVIETLVEDEIISYVNNLDIGEEFVRQELVSRILNVSEEIKSIGQTNKPFDDLFIYKESRLSDNRVRYTLIDNYIAFSDERMIVEQTIQSPIIVRSV